MNIVWFRYDLRLENNQALYNASLNNQPILPIFIIDKHVLSLGKCNLVWLYHSLTNLDKLCHNKLMILEGDSIEIIDKLIAKYAITNIYYNKVYEPNYLLMDKKLELTIREKYCDQINIDSFNSSLLFEPSSIKNKSGGNYNVFTPFYKCCLENINLIDDLLPNIKINFVNNITITKNITSLITIANQKWAIDIVKNWQIGSEYTLTKFSNFLQNLIVNYKIGRDIPSINAVSKLSPHIHFGEISVNQIYHNIKSYMIDVNYEHFFRELCWREFSYNILFYNNRLPFDNINKKFDNFSWDNNIDLYNKWTRGNTGIPIIDAGMRELWQTGYMHNRVRMIVGSFLVKNLLVHWHYGAKWFNDCLFDASIASNSASWQWVSGCGVDAAPYFRIFNPILQGQKFDSEGIYIKKYIPELSNLSTEYLFNPWLAPQDILAKASIKLGIDYPYPIIDLSQSRNRALEIYQSL
jgi:deoxyribodipyrimidine photo-lyase